MVMKIAGLQKVSTIDYPGEICCVVFLHGCNFRCGFCYNVSLVTGDFEGGYSEEEVLDFLKKRVGKLDAVCISGGEPLMSLDFDFARKIKEMGFKIKVDTNGSFPSRLREMIDLGLVDYIAMDVKGPRDDYSWIVGVNVDLDAIERSIRIVDDFGKGKIGSCMNLNEVGNEGENNSTRMNADERGFENKGDGMWTRQDERGFVDGKDFKSRMNADECGQTKGKSEFRTTIVSRFHSREKVVEMARWMNEVCGGKVGRIFLQGFKASGNFVDESFSEEKEIFEGELNELRDLIGEYFGEVGVRV